MVYKVPASKASLKKNRFEFTFPGDDEIFSVPKAEFLPPWLVSAIGDDMTKIQVAKTILDAFFDFDVLKKFDDSDQLAGWFEAWQKESGIALGESSASDNS